MATTSSMKVVWSELDHRLIQDSQGNIKLAENVAAVMSSIDNILRTRKGERCYLPEFGSNLMDAVFEPLDDTILKYLSRDLKTTIEKWDDRVIVDDMQLYPDPDQGALSITVVFSIKGQSGLYEYHTAIKSEEE
jgi:hypothetical protein